MKPEDFKNIKLIENDNKYLLNELPLWIYKKCYAWEAKMINKGDWECECKTNEDWINLLKQNDEIFFDINYNYILRYFSFGKHAITYNQIQAVIDNNPKIKQIINKPYLGKTIGVSIYCNDNGFYTAELEEWEDEHTYLPVILDSFDIQYQNGGVELANWNLDDHKPPHAETISWLEKNWNKFVELALNAKTRHKNLKEIL